VLVGLTVASTLALSLTLYVDAVYSDLLTSRLDSPPYGFRYRYLGQWNVNIDFDDVARADQAARDRFVETIGLPVNRSVSYVRGGRWPVQQDALSLGTLGLSVLDGAEDQMRIVDGEWPPPPAEEGVVPVLLPETMKYRMGVQVGDELTVARLAGGLTVEVAALWTPVNPDDPEWIFTPRFFDEVMLVESRDVLAGILGAQETPIDEAAWFLSFDGAQVRTTDVDALLAAIIEAQRTVDAALPGIRQDLTPQEELRAFNQEVDDLTQQLFIILAPVGGLVLYFVALVAGLLVRRQQNEDVKLRSRGMSRGGVLAIHALMWLMLASAALALSVIIAPLIVRLVGRTSSFLRFDSTVPLPEVVITLPPLLIAGATALVAASSGLLLAWRITGGTITSYRQEMSTATKAWWQRAYLDLLLLIPAGYVLYDLSQQGGVVADQGSAFSDPVVFLAPTLFALALALAFLRLWPLLIGAGARLIALTRNVSLLMALRELTRSIGRYRGALLMMAFTLSLTGFTASMASTLDRSLEDTVDYSVGADLVLVTVVDAQTEQTEDAGGAATQTVTGYNVPPVGDLRDVEGIAFISRFGRYPARLTVGTQRVEGTVIGVDRTELPAITRFREDFADDPLPALLNKLATTRTGIILSAAAAEEYNVIPGQEVTLGVQALNTWFDQRVPVIDVIDYFPTLDPDDPEDAFFAITNIEPVGTALPYDVWLALEPGASFDAVQARIRETGFPVLRWLEPEGALREAQAEPARRGVLGFLSVGFAASVALTLIAAIIQSTASFRAQSTQLGALRAMGLGGGTVGRYVVILQGLAASSGILAGTAIGAATTLLFLPLLDFSGGLPPYLVRVAWDEITLVYAVFAAVLFGVTMFTTLILSREQLATVVRLGDA
jgi:putative ABC transport system permease protein